MLNNQFALISRMHLNTSITPVIKQPAPLFSPSDECVQGSYSTNVAITAVVSCAVSFIIAALVGAMVHYCTVRKKCDCQKSRHVTTARKKQQQQQPAPLYADIVGQSQNIELKENVAYGPVQQ